jgi:(p)ppGpp synthase/HD superfamily hydrolase
MFIHARDFAMQAHGDQKYGDNPYVYHLDQVAEVLKEFGFNDKELMEAAYLHDMVEDTSVTLCDIARKFTSPVVRLVWAVTNEKEGSRKERQQKTYAKILSVKDAVVLKLADRIANVREGFRAGNDDKLQMYKKDYPEFRKALHPVLFTFAEERLADMWQELDRMMER